MYIYMHTRTHTPCCLDVMEIVSEKEGEGKPLHVCTACTVCLLLMKGYCLTEPFMYSLTLLILIHSWTMLTIRVRTYSRTCIHMCTLLIGYTIGNCQLFELKGARGTPTHVHMCA